MLAAAGSGVASLGIPGTDGVPAAAVADTLVVPYNDLDAVKAVFVERPEEIAAIIVEPVAANMGMVRPQPGFLTGLRELCDTYGSVLIFDEVITGFRLGLSGAQGRFGILPDLSTFGKVIGGGLPVGAYGGKRALMQKIAPEGPIFQAGTLSGNPLATAAGLAVLDLLSRKGTFESLEAHSQSLAQGLQKLADEVEIPFTSDFMGGIAGFFFRRPPIRNYADVCAADHERFKVFFHAMLEQGIYLAPSGFEVLFLTTAHGDEEIELTLEAARKAFKKVA
jgi:glutamate-1-semialdehyde 2,1-aminomutase